MKRALVIEIYPPEMNGVTIGRIAYHYAAGHPFTKNCVEIAFSS